MTIRRTHFRTTLAAAAVATALSPASPVQAQTLTSPDCDRLLLLVDEAGEGNVRAEFADARTVAEADEADACGLYVARVAELGGIAVDAERTESDAVTETVRIEQQATIEGEVRVTLPDPRVDIEQSPAEISVRGRLPEVSIDQARPNIVVRQAPPVILVRMSQPIVTVEQPAPEIVVTMPDPDVNVATARPTVEVNVPEPRVTVTQAEPRLDVDLNASIGEADRDPGLERSDADGAMVVAKSGLSSGELEPIVRYVDADAPAKVTFGRSVPAVEYVSAEPMIEVEPAGEPSVELIPVGEPKITIRESADDAAATDVPAAETREVALQEPAPIQPLAETPVDEAPVETAAEAPVETPAEPATPVTPTDAEAPGASTIALTEVPAGSAAADSATPVAEPTDAGVDDIATRAFTAGELDGMSIVDDRGEELGEVERVVRNGPDSYLILERGGWFFGLNGKEVAFPTAEIGVRDDAIVLRGMSEAQIEAMPDYDANGEVDLGVDEEVLIVRVDG